MISLENFDPYKKSPPYLDSPRSLEACKRQGIDPSELLFVSYDEYKKILKGQKIEEEWIRIRWEHFEDKRKEKLRILTEVHLLLAYDHNIKKIGTQRNLRTPTKA